MSWHHFQNKLIYIYIYLILRILGNLYLLNIFAEAWQKHSINIAFYDKMFHSQENLTWIPEDLTDTKSSLVLLMVWHHHAKIYDAVCYYEGTMGLFIEDKYTYMHQ